MSCTHGTPVLSSGERAVMKQEDLNAANYLGFYGSVRISVASFFSEAALIHIRAKSSAHFFVVD